jgi:hypothetical protein
LYSILFYVQVEDIKVFIKVWYTKKNRYIGSNTRRGAR